MNRLITSTAIPARAVKIEALTNMTASFESFCLASGIEALAEMMENDARTACGPRHARGKNRRAHRWGKTKGKIGFHGGKVAICVNSFRWKSVVDRLVRSAPRDRQEAACRSSDDSRNPILRPSSEPCGVISAYDRDLPSRHHLGILGGKDTDLLAVPDPGLAGRELTISWFAFPRCA